jgi:chorismate mutase/prephenate dehydratase
MKRNSRGNSLPRAGSLNTLRNKIDSIDEKILDLLNERAKLAIAAGHQKSGRGRSMYAPEREKRIFQRLAQRNDGPLKSEAVQTIFREIISACLALEKPLSVAYLGPEGTYSQQAAHGQFGAGAQLVPMGSIDAVFEEVERGRVDYGVVPVENSTEGVVAQTLDRFVTSPLTIKAEVMLRIDQCLLAKSSNPRRLRRIVSHGQSLAQCRTWLSQHYPRVLLEAVASNSAAAALAAQDGATAAVAGRQAALHYGLCVVAASIHDQSDNTTRFLVVSADGRNDPSEDDKTSILLSVAHESGALYRVLEPFARNGINMSTIESRPLKGRAWEYVFFIDVAGHESAPALKKALASIRRRSIFVKVLGSYPAWRWSDERVRDGS